jgi:hypothetical protein
MRDRLPLGIAPPTARRLINEKGGIKSRDMMGKRKLRLIRENQRYLTGNMLPAFPHV